MLCWLPMPLPPTIPQLDFSKTTLLSDLGPLTSDKVVSVAQATLLSAAGTASPGNTPPLEVHSISLGAVPKKEANSEVMEGLKKAMAEARNADVTEQLSLFNSLLKACEKALLTDPENEDIHTLVTEVKTEMVAIKDELFEAAEKFLKVPDYEKANFYCDILLKHDPNNKNWKDLKEKIRIAKQWVVDFLYTKAVSDYANKHLGDAAQACTALFMLEPKHDATQLKTSIDVEIVKINRLLEPIEARIQSEPNDFFALTTRANFYFLLDLIPEALADLTKARKLCTSTFLMASIDQTRHLIHQHLKAKGIPIPNV